MNCHEAKDRLTEGRETAALRRHVAACADCAAFRGELATGGRDLADAFLAAGPSPGFEDRVSARLRETEISVRPRPRPRVARRAALLLLPLAVAAGVLALPGDREPAAPDGPAPTPAAPPPREVVVTVPEAENPLVLRLRRDRSEGETVVDLFFAGDAREVELRAGVTDELLRAFARGARRAEVTVAPEVPGREITLLVEALERAGYAWDLLRRK